MKKFLLFALSLCFLLVIVPSATNHSFYCYATDEAIEDVISEGDIEDEISDQLDDLDFSELDKILENFTSNQSSIFGSSSFIEKLKQLISGDFDDGQSLFQGIINVFFESLLSLLPSLSIIIAISLLGNMIQ
ncbi:MAG: hypothetical protein IJZ62_03200, partial [Clostridia bacterium]|nr:hypothetical protein [Clostridia bacterium]